MLTLMSRLNKYASFLVSNLAGSPYFWNDPFSRVLEVVTAVVVSMELMESFS